MSYHIQSDKHWRISKSGYSIKTGWSDDSRIVAAFHAPVPFDSVRFERWLEDAQHACDLHNASVDGAVQADARIAELESRLSKLMAERYALLTIAHSARRAFTSHDAHTSDDQLMDLMNSSVEDARRMRRLDKHWVRKLVDGSVNEWQAANATGLSCIEVRKHADALKAKIDAARAGNGGGV